MIAMVMGMVPMMANPKVLAASAAAGAEIANAGATLSSAVAAVVVFVALANSTIVAPVVAYLVVGPRLHPQLEQIREWIHARRDAASVLTLIVAGVVVMLYGIS